VLPLGSHILSYNSNALSYRIVSRFDLNIDKSYAQSLQGISLEGLKQEPTNIDNNVQNILPTARALSVENRGLLTRHKLLHVLSKAQVDKQFYLIPDGGHDLEHTWFVIAKATAQTLGIILNLILEQSSRLGDEIAYWDEVLGSNLNTGHYTLQTGPSRIYLWASNTFSTLRATSTQENLTSLKEIARNWRPFYQIVQRNVQNGLFIRSRNTLLSPFSRCRADIRQKQQSLKAQKSLYASAIGILLEECFTFASDEQATDKPVLPHLEWCHGINKIVLLMETLLQNLSQPLASSKEFEDGVFHAVGNQIHSQSLEGPSLDVADVMERLISVLQSRIPRSATYNTTIIMKDGRPSIFARYWFPATVTLMSLTTSLRILTSRKAELMTWLSEFGSTIIDFWGNWVLQPLQKLIGTVRHDEQSEIAIMSRKSLEADWQSLERMVVDFVSDRSSETSGNLQDNIKTITTQVREGDLTPVLKAYERDLRKPFIGTVRGDLVRALLIQIQKTKVDVEVAIGGIDALLKSQELVFGLVDLYLHNYTGC
jgi:nuclear control of ATPase protein 2